MNVIIPMGGKGERFAREAGYRFPKPLINLAGRPMIRWLIDSLDLREGDLLFVAVPDWLDTQFGVEDRLRSAYADAPWSLTVVRLPFQTRGAAETAFVAASWVPPERRRLRTVSLDCDTIHTGPILQTLRELPPLEGAVAYFDAPESEPPIYSYLRLDSEGLVAEIVEKVPISAHANVGAYAFPTADALGAACASVMDAGGKECYLSSAVAAHVAAGNAVRGVRVDRSDFCCVGTPAQLREFLAFACASPRGRRLRVVFDLDNTLVGAPRTPGDYSTCEPRLRMVELARQLDAAGHTVIICTARRMRTHGGNAGAAAADVGLVTFETLRRFGIPCHEIHFGKPYADVYIDDLAVNALVDTERELGWVEPEPAPPIARPFHSVVVTDSQVFKSARGGHSLDAEVAYYARLPAAARALFPSVVERRADGFVLERVAAPEVAQLLLSRALTPERLVAVVEGLAALHSCGEFPIAFDDVYANLAGKTRARWESFPEAYGEFAGAAEVFRDVIAALEEYERGDFALRCALVHGDPVLSNVFLDRLRPVFIDPRGSLGGRLTSEGDALYDLAKVYQSLHGYDHMLRGLEPDEKTLAPLRAAFEAHVLSHPLYGSPLSRCGIGALRSLTASLFFSLIPLHPADGRRRSYFEAAERLCRCRDVAT